MAWRINAERLMLLAWVRAILLQLAHPLIAAGVADHSTFRGSTTAAFSRLHHTVSAMLAIAFGDETARQHAIDGIRTVHRRIHGTLAEPCGRFAAGTRYSAEDANLLLWVHATLIESVLITYEQVVQPLTDSERDAYCKASADVAVALGVPSPDVPRSWDRLAAYIANVHASGDLIVGQKATTLMDALTSPFHGRLVGVLLNPAMRFVAAAELPAEIRRQYNLPWSATRQRLYRGLVTILRGLRRPMPDVFTLWAVARRAESKLKGGGDRR